MAAGDLGMWLTSPSTRSTPASRALASCSFPAYPWSSEVQGGRSAAFSDVHTSAPVLKTDSAGGSHTNADEDRKQIMKDIQPIPLQASWAA
jgi:hypothetical protein